MSGNQVGQEGVQMMQMKREDYKAIKHMDRAQLTAYLKRVYRRGFDAGVKTMAEKTGHSITPAVAAPAPEAEG